MTDFAAGLFIWADLVIKYVGQRTGAGRPIKRLQDVLNDIRTQSRIQPGKVKELDEGVDCLYARILFESIQHSNPDERKDAKRILATVVLAKEPLRKCDLVELLSTDTSDPRGVLESIESTLWELSPIIPVSDANDELRVCHKTVSDFLLSHDRGVAAMKRVVESWNSDHRQKKWDLDTSISDLVLDCEKENRSLALACVHLWRRSFMDSRNVAELVRQANGSLYYASRHWLEHLEGRGRQPDTERKGPCGRNETRI